MAEAQAYVSAHAGWFFGGSILGIVFGMALAPYLVTRIPPDYFLHDRRHTKSHPFTLSGLVLAAIKNLIGAIFVVAGLLLLVLPGQGLITLLIGLMIMNYPGKFALERWLVQRPHVLASMNWLRGKLDYPPLISP
ncbi:MAG: PGPGW domain-containing protein [Candidatus Rariloculaceae bacterium]